MLIQLTGLPIVDRGQVAFRNFGQRVDLAHHEIGIRDHVGYFEITRRLGKQLIRQLAGPGEIAQRGVAHTFKAPGIGFVIRELLGPARMIYGLVEVAVLKCQFRHCEIAVGGLRILFDDLVDAGHRLLIPAHVAQRVGEV